MIEAVYSDESMDSPEWSDQIGSPEVIELPDYPEVSELSDMPELYHTLEMDDYRNTPVLLDLPDCQQSADSLILWWSGKLHIPKPPVIPIKGRSRQARFIARPKIVKKKLGLRIRRSFMSRSQLSTTEVNNMPLHPAVINSILPRAPIPQSDLVMDSMGSVPMLTIISGNGQSTRTRSNSHDNISDERGKSIIKQEVTARERGVASRTH